MEREKLAENLLSMGPLIFKKLTKGFHTLGISKLQLELLFMIWKNGGQPMTYYSEQMMVSKPNLTVMTDRVIKEGLIERSLDPDDRRVVTLKITKKGEDFLREHREKVLQEMTSRLDAFEDADVRRLNELLEEMKTIFTRINSTDGR